MVAHRENSESGRDSLAELFAGSSNFLDRMPMLRVALARTAEICTESLGDVSGEPPQLTLESLESGTAADLGAPGGDSRAAAVLHAPKWNARLVLVATRSSVFGMIESLLGGDGMQAPYSPERALTRIELRVAKVFFERMARALEGVFADIAPTSFLVEAAEEEPDLSVLGGLNNSVAVARYHFQSQGGSGSILLAVPRAALNPLRQALGRVPEKDAPAADAQWSRHIRTEVSRTHISLTAVLDERMSVLGEVAALRVGQIFELNATAHSRVRIECNGERLMWCQLGKSQGKYTLRVEEMIDREQEFMDDILAG